MSRHYLVRRWNDAKRLLHGIEQFLGAALCGLRFDGMDTLHGHFSFNFQNWLRTDVPK